MYIVVMMDRDLNPKLYGQLRNANRQLRRHRRNGIVKFRGLDWRFLPGKFCVEIHDRTIAEWPSPTWPRALKFAVIDHFILYDFVNGAEIEPGIYVYHTASAFVTLESPDGDEMLVCEIEIRGELLHDVNELYARMMSGQARPIAH